jgi:hypothetical protein
MFRARLRVAWFEARFFIVSFRWWRRVVRLAPAARRRFGSTRFFRDARFATLNATTRHPLLEDGGLEAH